jgi:hypothetical protein
VYVLLVIDPERVRLFVPALILAFAFKVIDPVKVTSVADELVKAPLELIPVPEIPIDSACPNE